MMRLSGITIDFSDTTRIPVGLVLGYPADGKTAGVIVAEFPDLTRDQIAACLDYARELAELEQVKI
jgi:uncharacterized protein (DUF433 family)